MRVSVPSECCGMLHLFSRRPPFDRQFIPTSHGAQSKVASNLAEPLPINSEKYPREACGGEHMFSMLVESVVRATFCISPKCQYLFFNVVLDPHISY